MSRIVKLLGAAWCLLGAGVPGPGGPVVAADAAPTVTFLRPEVGTPLFDVVDVELAIDSPDGVPPHRVELRFDGGVVGARSEPPWRFTVDVGPDNRDRTLYADVIRRDGAVLRAEFFAPQFEADEQIDLGLRQVYATVTDRHGARVIDLEASDFTLLDDRQRQKIVTFERGDIPFTAVLLVDGSGSMRGPALATALRGARGFVRSLEPYDEAKIMLFGDGLLASTRWLDSEQEAELAEQLEAAVAGLEADGGSALFDHLFLALQRAETRNGRRAVVLLTDGWDVHSVLTIDQMTEAARRCQAQIYAIRYGDLGMRGYDRQRGLDPSVLTSLHPAPETRTYFRSLDRLAELTGGRVLDVESVDQVDAALRDVLQELRQQVALGYYPSNRRGDGAWHEVELTVGRSGLDVRSREGYVDD